MNDRKPEEGTEDTFPGADPSAAATSPSREPLPRADSAGSPRPPQETAATAETVGVANLRGTVIGEKSSLARVGYEGGVTLDASAPTPGQGAPASTVEQALRLSGVSDEKYVVEEEIARGGMGVVLRAVDRDVRREVAMKLMRHDTSAEQRVRFVEEAQVLGQLEHPNIVPIHELGVDAGGRLFFTMKLVRGKTLDEILAAVKDNPHLEKEVYALPRLLHAFLNVCNAVDFAHSKGVVHRDLKPANIMLGSYGEVLVMDWGLAKVGAVRRLPPAQGAGINAMLRKVRRMRGKKSEFSPGDDLVATFRRGSGSGATQDGVISGTPAYMPPEQARGESSKIDERSDTYSLGAILYEILTLAPPVSGDSLRAVLTNVVQGNIEPPEKAAPARNIPSELSAIAMMALSAEPDDRYQTADAMRKDIELYMEGHAVSAKPDSMREALVKLLRRHREMSIVAAGAAVVLASVLGISYYLNVQERIEAEERLKKVKQSEEEYRGKVESLEAAIRQLKAQGKSAKPE